MKPALTYILPLALVPLAACSGTPDDVAVFTAPACIEHSPTLFGIDVSKWQGTINWAQVKGAGVQYAFIRVSDGISTIDEKFPANWAGAKAQSIPRGVYQFFRPNRDALEQAQIVIDHLEMYGMGELPPVIDVEATGDQTPAVVSAQVGIWIDEIESTLGVRPIIYSGSYFWDDNVKSAAFADYPFWIAHYTSAACPRLPAAWADWAFWQYSSTGSVAGVTGNCDVNRFAGTVEDLLDLVPDETCRLDPDWRSCSDDVASACIDGQIETTACGAGRSCVGVECAIDAPEPQPEVVEPSPEPQPEVAEPTPEPQPEVAEPQPEIAEPAPEVAEPEPDTSVAETSTEADAATTAGTPTRSISRREVVPAEGCATGTSTSGLGLLLALLYLLSFERTSQRPTP